MRIEHKDGALLLQEVSAGTRIKIEANAGIYVPYQTWTTKYPKDLILQVLKTKGLPYLIDEIRRDEDPSFVEQNLKLDLLSYLPAEHFANKRILDFGCGSGASTSVLARMFPTATVVGVELDDRHLVTAKMRAAFHGIEERVEFLVSPNSKALPPYIGLFDHILFCAVYEHLLPDERQPMMQLLWSHLKPGGRLFINDTPHRWFPLENHTTGLPLINYLPDRFAFKFAKKYSSRISRTMGDEQLYRLGIRGGTQADIIEKISPNQDTREIRALLPERNGVKDHIHLWERHSIRARSAKATKAVSFALRTLKIFTGITLVPTLSIALEKADASRH